MRYIWPTVQDMLSMLPPGDVAELCALVGTAGTGESAGQGDPRPPEK